MNTSEGNLGVSILPKDILHEDWGSQELNHQPSKLDLLYHLSHIHPTGNTRAPSG